MMGFRSHMHFVAFFEVNCLGNRDQYKQNKSEFNGNIFGTIIHI